MALVSDRTLGARLRELRRARGLSQLDLALIAGVTQQTVCFIERGTKRPQPRTVRRLAEALEVPMEQLAGGGDPAS